MMNINRGRLVLLVVIVLGIILHIIAAVNHDILYDGDAYVAMARSFAERGEFYMDWGTLWPPESNTPGPSHWCAPLYPLYLAMFYFIFGYSVEITVFASLLLSIMTLGAVYFATRSLFNDRYALYATAVAAMNPLLVLLTAYNFSENMVVLFFTLALWAMIKGMRQEKYMLLAGLFAGLGYLSRANVGYFFIIAALMGVAWRYKFMGLAFLKNRYYMGAVGIFGMIFAIWTTRNLALFGFPNWETNPMITEIVAYSLGQPLFLLYALGMKLLLFFVVIITLGAFFIPELSLKNILKDEKGSGYMLGVTLPIAIATLFMASYHVWLADHGFDKYIFWEEGARYVIISEIPLLWFIFHKHGAKDSPPVPSINAKRKWLLYALVGAVAVLAVLAVNPYRGVFILVALACLLAHLDMRKRLAVLIAVLTLSSVLVSISTDHPGYVRAARDLNDMVEGNDTLAVDFGEGGGSLYLLYPYLDNLDSKPVRYSPWVNTTYIISTNDISYTLEGYELLGTYESETGLMGFQGEVPFMSRPGEVRSRAYLWKRV